MMHIGVETGGAGGHAWPPQNFKVCFGPHTSMHWLTTELVSYLQYYIVHIAIGIGRICIHKGANLSAAH